MALVAPADGERPLRLGNVSDAAAALLAEEAQVEEQLTSVNAAADALRRESGVRYLRPTDQLSPDPIPARRSRFLRSLLAGLGFFALAGGAASLFLFELFPLAGNGDRQPIGSEFSLAPTPLRSSELGPPH